MCVYVCTCVTVCACTHVYVCVWERDIICACVHACMCVRVCACAQAQPPANICVNFCKRLSQPAWYAARLLVIQNSSCRGRGSCNWSHRMHAIEKTLSVCNSFAMCVLQCLKTSESVVRMKGSRAHAKVAASVASWADDRTWAQEGHPTLSISIDWNKWRRHDVVITTTPVTQMHDIVKMWQEGSKSSKAICSNEGLWLGAELEKAWEN